MKCFADIFYIYIVGRNTHNESLLSKIVRLLFLFYYCLHKSMFSEFNNRPDPMQVNTDTGINARSIISIELILKKFTKKK